jgi:Relaxase/Mobilisation nuclease domain
MPKRVVDLGAQRPLLDIVSYGRRGPGRPNTFTPAQRDHIARTVRRTPEVMVKVSGGARTVRGVGQHVDYIGREGELGVETDDEERLRGEGFEKALLKDWRLDLDAQQARALYSGTPGRKTPKLVHNIVLSMPASTPPDKLLKAVRKFAHEQFALTHRYAMALHTDQGNPHVHLVVKAMSEQGERLNIRKATLREWRQEFARHLREQGIAANATERAVRGRTQASKRDGIYRASQRRESTYWRDRAESVVRELQNGNVRAEPGKAKLQQTRQDVENGWRAVSEVLEREGQPALAAEVNRFVERMLPPRTEKEEIAKQLREHVRAKHIDAQHLTR